MDIKIGLILIVYYSLFGLVLLLGGSLFTEADGYTSNIDLNSSNISSSEIEQGGFFSTGVSFGRFFTLIAFGVGLPDDTPTGFKIFFAVWQSLISILAVMFVLSSIWNG